MVCSVLGQTRYSAVRIHVLNYMHTYVVRMYVFIPWCVGELWVDQRKMCADICDVRSTGH